MRHEANPTDAAARPALAPNASLAEQIADPGLEAVLAAWHLATVRLERTHEALRADVCRLTDELEVKNRELARKNRLADLGQMAAHVAHEVRNNLVPVALYLSLLQRRLSDDPGSLSIVGKISSSFTALDATVHDLLHFTSDREAHPSRFALVDLVDEVLASLAPQLAAQGVTTVSDVPANLCVTADRHMLRRVLLNLTLNAIDVMPEGGAVTVTAACGDDAVELEVADTGPGLSDEALARAFEPFYTTKANGTGLGLAIVGRIAEVHGGAVAATNCPEGGAAITLHIPQPILRKAAA